MAASATDRVRREAPLRRESPIRFTGTAGEEFQARAAACLGTIILVSLCLPNSKGGRPREKGPGPPDQLLVAGRHGNADAFLLEQFANMLEPLVLAEGDRATVGFALRFPRRILQVGLHECLDC